MAPPSISNYLSPDAQQDQAEIDLHALPLSRIHWAIVATVGREQQGRDPAESAAMLIAHDEESFGHNAFVASVSA
jgi:hypothetical protein